MTFDRTGIILYTRAYAACVIFYEETIGLPVLFRTDTLTCFAFGTAYLMVEIDDEYEREEPPNRRTRTCLRMNVPDVKAVADKVRISGVAVDYQAYDWGTVAKFRDPDGNLCAFKDSGTFEAQVAGR